MNSEILKRFFDENHMGSKGALCVGLVVTREAIERGLPIDFESLLTENRGQVRILASFGFWQRKVVVQTVAIWG